MIDVDYVNMPIEDDLEHGPADPAAAAAVTEDHLARTVNVRPPVSPEKVDPPRVELSEGEQAAAQKLSEQLADLIASQPPGLLPEPETVEEGIRIIIGALGGQLADDHKVTAKRNLPVIVRALQVLEQLRINNYRAIMQLRDVSRLQEQLESILHPTEPENPLG